MSFLYYVPSIYYVTADKIYQYINYQQGHKVIRMNPEPNIFIRLSNFFTEPTKIIDEIYLGSAFNACNSNQLSIDDTKVVLKIDTGGMEKKFSDIGKTKVAEDDISSAVNKLKNMKGK